VNRFALGSVVNKLGLLLSTPPGQPGFVRCLQAARAGLAEGAQVYLYCLDDGVLAVSDPQLQTLRTAGLKLFACAYGAQRRGVPCDDRAVFSGLATLSDILVGTRQFIDCQ
jgi:sulfur relay (sulfurtransferase) complex TusBCD TusD component (DsrE family)